MQKLRKEGKRQCATDEEKGTIHDQGLFRNVFPDKSKPPCRCNNFRAGPSGPSLVSTASHRPRISSILSFEYKTGLSFPAFSMSAFPSVLSPSVTAVIPASQFRWATSSEPTAFFT